MSIENLLSRLRKVKKTGQGRWLACCPAHDDRSPSLSVKLESDGRILIHDFAGCSVEEILDSVGLTFDELFPERLMDHGKPLHRPFNAHDVLEALSSESMVVAVSANKLFHGEYFTVAEWERLKLANQRISAARDMTNA
jgi:hypothetical protein